MPSVQVDKAWKLFIGFNYKAIIADIDKSRYGSTEETESRFGAVVEWEGQTDAGEEYRLFLFFGFFSFGYRKEILLLNRKEYVIFPPNVHNAD